MAAVLEVVIVGVSGDGTSGADDIAEVLRGDIGTAGCCCCCWSWGKGAVVLVMMALDMAEVVEEVAMCSANGSSDEWNVRCF